MSGTLQVGGITLGTHNSGTGKVDITNAGTANIADATITAGTLGASVVGGNMAVGTVSESSGTPTGDIIQRGSNSNGEYVRYADGTQICTIKDKTSTSSGSTTWTFPVAFASGTEPVCVGTSGDSEKRIVIPGSNTGISNTFFNFAAMFPTNSFGTQGGTINYSTSPQNITAIGRWY